MAKLWGFGSAAVDFRIQTAELGEDYRDKLLAKKIEMMGGGSVANCLVQAARLGAKTGWLGKLGQDWIGEAILKQFATEEVDCGGVIFDHSVCSPFNLACYAGEARRRIGGFLLPNSLGTLTEVEVKKLVSSVDSGDWILAELGEIPLETTLAFCREVKARKGKLAIDVDLDPIRQCVGNSECVTKIFESADLLIPNQFAMDAMYPGLSGATLAKTICDEFNIPVVVTAGAEGAYYCRLKEDVQKQESFPVNCIDSVGAGDAFHGGLLFGLLAGWDLSKAVTLAAQCGGKACEAFGARTGMLTAKEFGL